MNYGFALKELRRLNNLKAQDVAAKLKISKSYYSEIENNKRRPSVTFLEKVAKLYYIKLSALIELVEAYN